MQSTSPFFRVEDYKEVRNKYWGKVYKLPSLGRGISQFLVVFFPYKAHLLHRHPNHKETVFVVQGQLTQYIEGHGMVVLKPMQTAFIGRNVPHRATPGKNTVVLVTLHGKGSKYESIEMEKQEESNVPSRTRSKKTRSPKRTAGKPGDSKKDATKGRSVKAAVAKARPRKAHAGKAR